MKKYFQCLLFAVLVHSTTAIQANSDAIGTWKTESSGNGYIHVLVEYCENKLCGTIDSAFGKEGKSAPGYEHIGKRMIWNMQPKSAASWGSGRIRDPTENKTYKSKMSVSGDVLTVSGCVFLFCKSQKWTRIR